METIIQQMAIELVERVLKNLRENGISNIGQAAKELQSIANAAEKSMEKAAKDVGAAVSKQTVNNKVLALKEAAAEYLPNVHFVMDGFHLQKYLRKLGRLEGAAHYMGAIRRAIRKDAFEKFVSYCAAIDEKQDEQGHEKLMELVHYFENNWEAIVMRMQNEVCGSCTESLVSHVLSARLSRNPLAWSEHGID